MMLLNCLPDEFAPGYRGRWAHVSVDISPSGLRAHLISQFDLPSDTSEVVALAHAARMSLADFAQLHTVTPARRLFVLPHKIHRKQDKQSFNRRAMQASTVTARLCPQCVEEDIEHHGFSYWRRSHHLEGIDWCAKHLNPLHEMYGRDWVFNSQPSQYVEMARPISCGVQDFSEWPTLLRLIEIAQGTLDLRGSVTTTDIGQALKQQIKVVKQRGADECSRTLLSNLAREQLPQDWLKRHFPKLASSLFGQYYATLDAITREHDSRRSYLIYIVALALVCDSAEDALRLIESARELPPACANSPPQTTHAGAFPQSTDLRSLYVACGGSHSCIAEKLGLPSVDVEDELSKTGLPELGSMPVGVAQALRDYLNGTPLADLLKQRETLAGQLDHWLRQDLWTIRHLLDRRLEGLTTRH